MHRRALQIGQTIVELTIIKAIGPVEYCLPDGHGKWTGERTFLSPGFKIYTTVGMLAPTFQTPEEATEARAYIAYMVWDIIEEDDAPYEPELPAAMGKMLEVVKDVPKGNQPSESMIIRSMMRLLNSIGIQGPR